MKRWFAMVGALMLMISAGAWAYGQEAPQTAPQDQPQPGVARISLINGDVSIQRGDSGDWAAATLNTPVVAGDKVSTGQAARTEVQLDYANILRLSDQSQANIATLDRLRIQVQLAQGLAFYSVFKGAEADAEIDTPNVAVHPRGEGEFRIQVNANETVVVIRKGVADISRPEGSTQVHKGQMVTIRGTGAETQYLIADAPAKDQWDQFNGDRDNRIRSAESWARVDPYYTGANDLDAYGRWVNVPDYGSVWSPTVDADWAPYRAGNWVWEPYYGWTWVSYEPWGWAPYHYGRWFLYDSAWCWWPGPRWHHPIWAPAYVSFLGFDAGNFGFSLGFGFGFGSIGWFPIGPCDAYFPWYGGYGHHFGFADYRRFYDHDYYRHNPGAYAPLSARYNERYSNFRMAERDRHFLNSVSSVRAEQFGRGGVSQRAAGISANDFRSGRMMTGGIPVVPTRQSLAASTRAASPSTIRSEQGMRFFSRTSTPSAPRPSFNEQASRVQNALRSGGARATMPEGMPRGGVTGRPGTGSSPSSSTRSASGNVVRPGNETNAGSYRGSQATGASEGWRRFGGSNAAGSPGGGSRGTQPSPGTAGTDYSRPATRSAPSTYSARTYGGAGSPPPQSSQPQGNQGSWQRFPSRPAQSSPQSPAGRSSPPPSQPRYDSSRPSGGYSAQRSYGAPGYSSRPPLNMSRPIISGPPRSGAPSRSYGGYGGSAPRQGGSSQRGGGGGRSPNSSRHR